MWAEIKSLFASPSAEVIAQRELERARINLLEAQSDMEKAQAYLTFTRERVQRLQQFLDDYHRAEVEKALRHPNLLIRPK